MEAPEKNRCNSSEAAHGAIFSGPVGEGNTAKTRPFRIFQDRQTGVSLQLRLCGGGRSQVRTLIRCNSLLTGKNTGNFALKRPTDYVPQRDICRVSCNLRQRSRRMWLYETGNKLEPNRESSSLLTSPGSPRL